jgi:hypothetical protein
MAWVSIQCADSWAVKSLLLSCWSAYSRNRWRSLLPAVIVKAISAVVVAPPPAPSPHSREIQFPLIQLPKKLGTNKMNYILVTVTVSINSASEEAWHVESVTSVTIKSQFPLIQLPKKLGTNVQSADLPALQLFPLIQLPKKLGT